MNKPVLCVGDPELIKTILVKDFHKFPERIPVKNLHPLGKYNLVEAKGDIWKRLRSISSQAFTSGKMKRMYPKMKECLQNFIKHLDKFATEGQEINAKDIFGNLTLDVIASSAFATKLDTQNELDNPFVVNARKAFTRSIARIFLLIAFPNWLLKLINVENVANVSACDFFFKTTKHLISDRKRNPNKRYNDMIELLINAEKGSNDSKDDMDVNEAHHVNEG